MNKRIFYFYGPPMSGKTLLLRSLWHQIDGSILVLASNISISSLKKHITANPKGTILIDEVVGKNRLFKFLTSDWVQGMEVNLYLAGQSPVPEKYAEYFFQYPLQGSNPSNSNQL